MSIIQEALKKAQGEFSKNKSPSVKAPDAPVRPAQMNTGAAQAAAKGAKPSKKTPSLSVPALVGVLTVLLIIYGLDLSLRHSGANNKNPVALNKKSVSSKAGSSAKTRDRFASPLMDPAKLIPSRMGQFVLSGIMYVENKPQAIINGYVLEEGDKINGATILAIEKDCVLLNLNDSDIRLGLNNE